MRAGNKKVYEIEAGATNVTVRGTVNTGVVWKGDKGWVEEFNETYQIPQTLCFKLYGTTLNRKWSRDCN